MDQLQFTIPEILSLIGVTQCVYILVYMSMRAGRLSRAGLPILYFFVLGIAFFADFGQRSVGEITPYYFYIQWAAWFLGPPLSVLLIIQIARITSTPALKHYWVLLLIPFAFLWARVIGNVQCVDGEICNDLKSVLIAFGMIAGCISLLAIWGNRGLFSTITSEKTGESRYWLILALIFMNVFFLLSMLLSVSLNIAEQQIMLIRTILGLGFVYLVGTSLFRIYPQAVRIEETKISPLSSEETAIAKKVESLLSLEKVYHEPTYSRADLARECSTSEAVLSKIINVYFNKSFPQLINEHRIEDAKRLLRETEANVNVVAEQVGFNSLPTFNRVFKEITGSTPGQYRQEQAA